MRLFRPLASRTARWRPAEGEGLEHLDLRRLPGGGLLASAVAIGGMWMLVEAWATGKLSGLG